MKTIYRSLFILIIVFFQLSLCFADWIIWNDFESHQWKGEGWGGESPQVNIATFDGKQVLQMQLKGTANYGFWRTEYFPDENWNEVTGIQTNIYLQASGKKSITSKLEVKNHDGVTIEQLWSPVLPLNQWVPVTWKPTPGKDYSRVAMVVMNLEGFQDTPVTVYIHHLSLVKSSATELWDSFNKTSPSWQYRGAFNPWWSNLGYEVVSHNHTSSVTPVGAAYLSWKYEGKESWAEIVNPLHENWSGYSKVRYDIYSSDTLAPFTVYIYDGKTGYEPPAKQVSKPNTWQTLTWDLSYPAGFNPVTIKEFKCVTIDLSKHPRGDAYFDNIQVFKNQ